MSALQNQLTSEPTIVVCGITRSGLTLTMQMLGAAGFDLAGGSWPWELYPMGEIPWADMKGKVVKVVDTQNQIPPKEHGPYRVILLKRNFKQQAKSIEKFIKFFGVALHKKGRGNAIVKSLEADYSKIHSWGMNQMSFEVVNFETIIQLPEIAAHQILSLASGLSDTDNKVTECMASVVISRSSDCHPTMLEADILNKNNVEKPAPKKVWDFLTGQFKLK